MVNRAKVVESILVALVLVIVSGVLLSLRQPVEETPGQVPILDIGDGQFVDVESGTRYQGLSDAPLLLLGKKDEDTWWGLTRNGLYYGSGGKVKKVATPESMGVTPTGGTFSIPPGEDPEIIVEGTDPSGDPVEVPIDLDPDTGEATPGEPTPVPDTTAPMITILGDNPDTITAGTYYDAGATATDDVDGDLTSAIVVTSTIEITPSGTVSATPVEPGTYTVTYTVSDAAGNTAVAVRTVIVGTPVPPPVPVDTAAPVITILGSDPVTITAGTIYADSGATATDDVDGDITASIIVTSTVDDSTPGTYTVTYTVTDAAGNTAVAVRTVIVEAPAPPPAPADTTAPVITILGSDPVTIIAGTTYVDAGATATDDIDGDLTASIIVTSTVDDSTPGTYTVTYAVSDAAGNTAVAVRTVIVEAPPAPAPAPVPAPSPGFVYLPGSCIVATPCCGYPPTVACAAATSVDLCAFTLSPSGTPTSTGIIPAATLTTVVVATAEELAAAADALAADESAASSTTEGYTVTAYLTSDPTIVDVVITGPPGPVLLKWWSLDPPILPEATVITLTPTGSTVVEIPSPIILSEPGTTLVSIPYDPAKVLYLQASAVDTPLYPDLPGCGGTFEEPIAEPIDPGDVGFAVADHFTCYPVTGTSPNQGVFVWDQFGWRGLQVQQTKKLCTPAVKEVGKTNMSILPGYPDKHFVCYKAQSGWIGAISWVLDQFGQRIVLAEYQDELCVPAEKTVTVGTPDPAPKGNTSIDHWDCFPIIPEQINQVVTIRDQFGQREIMVDELRRLCAPADKLWNQDELRPPQTNEHFLCYNVTPLQSIPGFAVTTVDQFNTQDLVIPDVEELCVPAQKQFQRFFSAPPGGEDGRGGTCGVVEGTRFCSPDYTDISGAPCYSYYTGPGPTTAKVCGTKYSCGAGPLYPVMEC
ncbi:DUF5011 domain-containing protein [Candidatus Woesearchaeota archaeon]|nr:DUF5011 domain-containing protein [Candidatus Woesearchaeota archaeon]